MVDLVNEPESGRKKFLHGTPSSSPSSEKKPEIISSFDWESSPVKISAAERITEDSVSVTPGLSKFGCECWVKAGKRAKERRSLVVALLVACES